MIMHFFKKSFNVPPYGCSMFLVFAVAGRTNEMMYPRPSMSDEETLYRYYYEITIIVHIDPVL
jgi:hypothetical protein